MLRRAPRSSEPSLPVSVSPRKRDRARGRPVERQHHAGERRLAAAGAADQRRRLAGPDREGDVVDGAERLAGSRSSDSRGGRDRSRDDRWRLRAGGLVPASRRRRVALRALPAHASRPAPAAACRDAICADSVRAVSPSSITSPPRRMVMRSAMSATTARSCEISSSPMRFSSTRSRSSSRICSCSTTSSAVVGSSAISSFGFSAQAMAMTTRWRWPPDSSCG